MRLATRSLWKLIRFWPPMLGAGIKVRWVDDFTIESWMNLRFYNSNIVGVHYGGSLYSMCDPFYMAIFMERLGKDYIVWDKASTIQFRRPGKGRVTARFHIPPEEVERVRKAAHEQGKLEPVYETDVLDEQGQVVAHVIKTLYVRPKGPRP